MWRIGSGLFSIAYLIQKLVYGLQISSEQCILILMIGLLHLHLLFTPLASKVFKHKKRLRVENEEECQEEWSRSKKSKFIYTKPTVGKVN